MKMFELLQDLDAEANLEKLSEAKRKRQIPLTSTGSEKKTGGARSFDMANRPTTGGSHKDKKRASKNPRKAKHRGHQNDY